MAVKSLQKRRLARKKITKMILSYVVHKRWKKVIMENA